MTFTRHYEKWYNIPAILKHYCRDVQCAYQKSQKGYCFRDIWEIDSWFLEIFPKMLRDLKSVTNSFPSEFSEKNGYNEWISILEYMALCFDEASEDKCSLENGYEYESNFRTKPSNDGMKELIITYPTEQDEENSKKWFNKERDIRKYKEKKLQEGLDLLKKYFWDLWD